MSLFLTNIFACIKLQNKQVSFRNVGKSVFSFQEKHIIFFAIYFNKIKFTLIVYVLTEARSRKCKGTTNIIIEPGSSVGIANGYALDVPRIESR